MYSIQFKINSYTVLDYEFSHYQETGPDFNTMNYVFYKWVFVLASNTNYAVIV